MGLKILHGVELYAPSVGGAQEVVRQVSERLVARGHEVTVATAASHGRASSIAGVGIVEFDVRGNTVRGIEGDVGAYRRFVTEGDFDVVMTYAAQQWTTDALLDVLADIPAPTVLAPCGFSGLGAPAYATYFDGLRERLQDFDELIFHSETYQDIEFARAAGATHLTVIPNAADEREFESVPDGEAFRKSHGLGPGSPVLLTVGAHTGLKGHPLAMGALRSAKRARHGTLAIIGNTPTGRGCLTACRVRAGVTRAVGRGRRVLLLDPPRPDVLAAYGAADLFLLCSMVECSPLVLFEAMAAGLPFVSLDVGNAAEIAERSGAGIIVPSRRREDGLVEANPADVGQAIDTLLADADRRRVMSEQGRRAWRERFTWDAVTDRYEELYARLAA